jgi:large repetitive protein
LFTVTISDNPFADELFLTNQATVKENSTNNIPITATQINKIELRNPKLKISKGIVDTSNNNEVFNPATIAPARISFSPAGTSSTCKHFSGTINSTNLATNGINLNVSDIRCKLYN